MVYLFLQEEEELLDSMCCLFARFLWSNFPLTGAGVLTGVGVMAGTGFRAGAGAFLVVGVGGLGLLSSSMTKPPAIALGHNLFGMIL